LPEAIAKGLSARWVYVPASVSRDLAGYVRWDRDAVVEEARALGRYAAWRRPWVVTALERAEARRVGSSEQVKVAQLDSSDRRRLLVEGLQGLGPAWFLLGENGQPLSVSAWKGVLLTPTGVAPAPGWTCAAIRICCGTPSRWSPWSSYSGATWPRWLNKIRCNGERRLAEPAAVIAGLPPDQRPLPSVAAYDELLARRPVRSGDSDAIDATTDTKGHVS
jgi:hypothetical protein